MTMFRHFLDLSDLTKADASTLLDDAKAMKAARAGLPKGALDPTPRLTGHVLAMIFEKSSTRTRISFDMAMRQMGGSTIVMQSSDMQLGRGETVSDTAKVLSRFVDMIMLRANSHNTLTELASGADVPVINALTDFSHPCQLLADVLTLEEKLGSLEGKKVAWIGDGNNVATSLIHAASLFDFSLNLACPENLSPSPAALAWNNDNGGDITVTTDPVAAAEGADALITDCWVSMGDTDADERMALLKPYQIDDALMSKAKDNALFLHCLPAHRGEEMTSSVIDGPQSVVFDEAENRLHAQKAVLAWCLNK